MKYDYLHFLIYVQNMLLLHVRVTNIFRIIMKIIKRKAHRRILNEAEKSGEENVIKAKKFVK